MTRKKSQAKCPYNYNHSVFEDFIFNVERYDYCQECKDDVLKLVEKQKSELGISVTRSDFYKFCELNTAEKFDLIKYNPNYQHTAEFNLLPTKVKDEIYRIYHEYFHC